MKNNKKTDYQNDVIKIFTNSQEFDDYAKTLQDFIDQEEEALYSEVVRKEYRSPVNLGIIQNCDGKARFTGPCGDTMEFYIKIKENTIEQIKFQTNGCGITVAAGSMLTRLSKGKNLEDVQKIEPQNLTDALDGLPPENLHCSLLSVTTLRMAIDDHFKGKKKDVDNISSDLEDIIP